MGSFVVVLYVVLPVEHEQAVIFPQIESPFRIYFSKVAPRQYFLALISESWCKAAHGVSLEGASGMRDAEISNFGVRPRRRSRPKLPGALTMSFWPIAYLSKKVDAPGEQMLIHTVWDAGYS